jgi:hypothetical protein
MLSVTRYRVTFWCRQSCALLAGCSAEDNTTRNSPLFPSLLKMILDLKMFVAIREGRCLSCINFSVPLREANPLALPHLEQNLAFLSFTLNYRCPQNLPNKC